MVLFWQDIVCEVPHCVPISAHHKWNYDSLLEKMWEYLALVRIYTKPKGQLPDYSSPVVLNSSRYEFGSDETSNLSCFQVAQISDPQYAKTLADPP